MTDTARRRFEPSDVSEREDTKEASSENPPPYSVSVSSSNLTTSSFICSKHTTNDSSMSTCTPNNSENNSHQDKQLADTPLSASDSKSNNSSGPNQSGGSIKGAAESSTVSVQLLHRKQLPHHLQFNPYIDTGYRPLLTSWECVKSLFYLHNETVNIVTHGVPMLYILLMWKVLLPWNEVTVPVLPWTHLLSCVSPWVGSTIYHLFMNHKAGEGCYRSLLQLDMFGIWITQSFGALTTVYASVSCLGAQWVWRVLAGYCLVSLWCLYKASHARNPWERRFCFTLPFLMRAAAVLVRLSSYGGGDPRAFRHIVLQDLLAVVGGFVGALRIPEKWLPPSSVDLVANSHHIMHVVVVWAVYHLHQGATLDLVWLSQNKQCPGLMTY